jgi:phenylalanyl-tRNA synthetase beta chain
LSRILGIEVPSGDVISILRRLGFRVRGGKKRALNVEIPPFRAMDIEREIDLVEEVARIYGYNRIETTMPDTAFPGKEIGREDELRQKVRQILAGCGLNEAQSYSMLGQAEFEKVGISPEKAVRIANPLTVEESIMRTHILPGLLKVASHNQNRQIENIFLFEIGKTFSASKNKLPEEKWVLGGLASGSPFMSDLDKGEADYSYIKGMVENLFSGLGIEFPKVLETDNFLVQPGKGAEIEGIGIFGALHPDICRNFELSKTAFFFEIDLDALFKMIGEGMRYQPLPKYPAISRDISMFIPAELENQKIVELIYKTGGRLVEEVFPFDKYKDSVAYRLVYRHPERTLTEAEVNSKHQEIIQALTSKLMVRIR